VPHKYLKVQGIATYLHHVGPTVLPEVPPDLSRGPIVCLHDAGQSGAVFAALLAQLAEAHSPVAFDQPAHGRSAELDSLGSLERMAEFSAALMALLGIESPVLVGHGMGGSVALECALSKRVAPRALVLAGAAASWSIPAERLERMRRVTEGKATREWRRERCSPSASPELLRNLFAEDARTDPRATYADLLACTGWNVEDRLGELAVPTLVVSGEDEEPELTAAAERLAAGIPSARALRIPKAGHMLPFEQPAALASAVHEFLGGLRA
jgi:pimeloyl-ACP methyl ester carboxylesterase